MANRRNRKKPSERGGSSNGRPSNEPDRSDESRPFRRELDPKWGFIYPNLRMKLVAIPCPSCSTLIDVLAENHTRPQDVRIAYHKNDQGETCDVSERLIPLPVPDENSGVAYVALGNPRSDLDPSAVEHLVPAPPACRSSSDWMLDYALACPVATLIKVHRDLTKMAEMASDISYAFRPDDFHEDSLCAHVESLRGQVEEALTKRFSAGIAEKLHVEDDRLSFQDPITLQHVLIPIEDIRVSQLLRSTLIRPNSMNEDDDPGEEGEQQP